MICCKNRYRRHKQWQRPCNSGLNKERTKAHGTCFPFSLKRPCSPFLSRQAIIDPGFYATQGTGHFNVDCADSAILNAPLFQYFKWNRYRKTDIQTVLNPYILNTLIKFFFLSSSTDSFIKRLFVLGPLFHRCSQS